LKLANTRLKAMQKSEGGISAKADSEIRNRSRQRQLALIGVAQEKCAN
jgi:hypothetical protein